MESPFVELCERGGGIGEVPEYAIKKGPKRGRGGEGFHDHTTKRPFEGGEVGVTVLTPLFKERRN